MPGLRGAEAVDVADASGVDGCPDDLVAGDEFILGPVPGAAEVHAGVGWRGTGYEFAPRVGRVLACSRAPGNDIRRFAPARFAGGCGAAG